MKKIMKYKYSLQERCKIVELAARASEELNAGQLINWFEKNVEQKRKEAHKENLKNLGIYKLPGEYTDK